MTFRRDKFFVLRLGERHFRPSPDQEIEVQLLDSRGREVRSVFLKSGDAGRVVDDFEIPPAVIEAAWRQEPGKGDYVNARGESTTPF
jgi:hypothetical protein